MGGRTDGREGGREGVGLAGVRVSNRFSPPLRMSGRPAAGGAVSWPGELHPLAPRLMVIGGSLAGGPAEEGRCTPGPSLSPPPDREGGFGSGGGCVGGGSEVWGRG